MSLKYMGVPSACRHGGYEDRCEVCALERENEKLRCKVAYLIKQGRSLLRLVDDPALTEFYEDIVFKGPWKGVTSGKAD